MVKAGGEKGWYYFNLLVLILFAGLRYRIGGDTLLYMGMFEECPKLQDLKYFDFASAQYNPLWYILNGLSRSIYDDFFLFQLIHAFIVNVSFFHFFRKFWEFLGDDIIKNLLQNPQFREIISKKLSVRN